MHKNFLLLFKTVKFTQLVKFKLKDKIKDIVYTIKEDASEWKTILIATSKEA